MSEAILNKSDQYNGQQAEVGSTEKREIIENSLGKRISNLKDSLKSKNFKFYQSQNETSADQKVDQDASDATDNKVMMIGMVVEVVVIKKNDELKQFGVQLNRFHSFCDSCLSTKLQESDLLTLRSKKSALDKLLRLYEFKIKAIIREQEIVGKIIKK